MIIIFYLDIILWFKYNGNFPEIINKIKRPIFSLEQLLIKCYAASSSSYFLLPLMFVGSKACRRDLRPEIEREEEEKRKRKKENKKVIFYPQKLAEPIALVFCSTSCWTQNQCGPCFVTQLKSIQSAVSHLFH